jgi:GNAT superfamily N-acetyltransferase
VPEPSLEFRPTLDRAWLEAEAARDPIVHAFALWDLDHHPAQIRLLSAEVDGRPLGYLLVWLGHPTSSVVHWVGTDPRLADLAGQLPPRPLVAVVPPEFRDAVERARGPVREYPLLTLLSVEPAPARNAEASGVRRLRRADRPGVVSWAARQDDPVVAEYPTLDPEEEMLWGTFDGDRLVGVVRAAVRLPQVWILGGVYVEPSARGGGRGRALVETALGAASDAGARLALFVREDRAPARALYAALGFQPVARRLWLDAGSGLYP